MKFLKENCEKYGKKFKALNSNRFTQILLIILTADILFLLLIFNTLTED